MTENTDDLDISVGLWWKFSSYEVSDNCIRPTAGANLMRYDPWVEFAQSLIKKNNIARPYLSLVKLVDGIGVPPPDLKRSQEAQALIVDWCNKYGLLGLLPQNSLMAVVRARWEPRRGMTDELPLIPTTHTLMRTNGGWRSDSDFCEGGPEEYRLNQKGCVVPDECVPVALQRTGVMEQAWVGRRLQWSSFTDTWAPFFPDVPPEDRESFRYPCPLSDQFWHSYAEPIYGIWNTAVTFRNLVKAFANITEPISLDSDPKERINLFQSGQFLDALLSAVAPRLALNSEGYLKEQWACGSLVASFSLMLLRDFTVKNTRPLSCINCGSIFTTSVRTARYCSDRCRSNVQKRRQRAKEQAIRVARKQEIRGAKTKSKSKLTSKV